MDGFNSCQMTNWIPIRLVCKLDMKSYGKSYTDSYMAFKGSFTLAFLMCRLNKNADWLAARRRRAQLNIGFNCTSTLQSNAVDGFLHIQSARRKRKCNPLESPNLSPIYVVWLIITKCDYAHGGIAVWSGICATQISSPRDRWIEPGSAASNNATKDMNLWWGHVEEATGQINGCWKVWGVIYESCLVANLCLTYFCCL
jgi:hypothetical protein